MRISMRDLRVMGRNTQGVKLANLKNEDVLIAIQKIENGQENAGEEKVEEESAEVEPEKA